MEYNPSYTFTGQSIDKRDILLTAHNPFVERRYGHLYVFSYDGVLKKDLITDQLAVDFKPLRYSDGYCYCLCYGAFPSANGWYDIGPICLTDSELHTYKQLWIKPFGRLSNLGDCQNCQCHDCLILGDDHYFLLGLSKEQVEVNGIKTCVVNNIIQEQLNGEVVWQFESIDYPQLFEYSTFHNNYAAPKSVAGARAQDYAHMNSIALTSDHKYMYISFRNIGIVKLEMETKRIVWIIGKKYCSLDIRSDNIPQYQHDLRLLDDDTFTVFDNWGSEHSRIAKFKIVGDEVISAESIDTGKKWSRAMGSVITLDNNIYDVCYGCIYGNSVPFEELNATTGERNMSFKFNNPVILLYRVERGKLNEQTQ